MEGLYRVWLMGLNVIINCKSRPLYQSAMPCPGTHRAWNEKAAVGNDASVPQHRQQQNEEHTPDTENTKSGEEALHWQVSNLKWSATSKEGRPKYATYLYTFQISLQLSLHSAQTHIYSLSQILYLKTLKIHTKHKEKLPNIKYVLLKVTSFIW